MERIGIDVHKVAIQVCIRTDDGTFVEPRIPRTREAFAKRLGGRVRARIFLGREAGPGLFGRCAGDKPDFNLWPKLDPT